MERTSSAIRCKRIGKVVDQRPEQAFALGEAADVVDHVVGHAGVDELGKAPVGGDDAQRGVAGAHQLARGLGDVPQHGGEIEVADDQLDGLEQATETALGGYDLLGAVHQLPEELIQLQARQVREPQLDLLGCRDRIGWPRTAHRACPLPVRTDGHLNAGPRSGCFDTPGPGRVEPAVSTTSPYPPVQAMSRMCRVCGTSFDWRSGGLDDE